MSSALDDINWEQITLLIFDVDGTLYDQKKMRTKMMFELCKYYSLRPWKIGEIKLLKSFREHREYLAHNETNNIIERQYEISVKSNSDQVNKVVNHWIRKEPLKHINKYTFQGAVDLFTFLNKREIKFAVLSDYSPQEKLVAMGLLCENQYSGESKEINILKPHPKGINFVLQNLGVPNQNALYIGDRYDTDGKASSRAGVSFIKVSRSDANNIYSMIQERIRDVG